MERAMSREGSVSSVVGDHPVHAVVVGGLLVGVLDLAYAILVYSPRKPLLILRGIATGVLGPKSYEGGIRTAALGLMLHFIIAFSATIVYYLLSQKVTYLINHFVFAGLIYGALVYSFMHWVVVPLSLVPHFPSSLIPQVCEFVEHLFFVGLPIAWSVRRYSPP